jgi:hypothetical protein
MVVRPAPTRDELWRIPPPLDRLFLSSGQSLERRPESPGADAPSAAYFVIGAQFCVRCVSAT